MPQKYPFKAMTLTFGVFDVAMEFLSLISNKHIHGKGKYLSVAKSLTCRTD